MIHDGFRVPGLPPQHQKPPTLISLMFRLPISLSEQMEVGKRYSI